MLQPGDLKRGGIIEIDGQPCVIETVTVQTPSSRGANTIWKVRARNVRTQQKVDKAYRSGESIVEPNFEKRAVQFLYSDNTGYHFMDLTSYDQFELSAEDLGNDALYLIDNMEGIRSLVLEEEIIGVEVPATVDLSITECDPSVKGNSATSRAKNATLETGLGVQVPEHLDVGDIVRVDTATGKFLSRVSK